MTPKDRTPVAARRKTRTQSRAEQRAATQVNSELQKAIARVDWANVKLPRQSC